MIRINLLFLVLFYALSIFAAGPILDTFGAGARNKALGGAGINIAEDYTATFYNPSLLALCRGSRLSIGYDFIHTGLNDNDPSAEQLGNYSSIDMGFCLKPLNQVGIGVYSNFSLGPITFSPSTLAPNPDFILYGKDLKTFSMIMGIGYAPIKELSLGLALSISSGVNLQTNLKVNPFSATPIFAEFPAQITPVTGIIASATGIPLDDLRISAVYRSETYGKMDILTTVSLNGNPPFQSTKIEGTLAYSPHQIALGSSYLLSNTWLFTADATYYFWSNYKGPFLEIQNDPNSALAPGLKIASTVPPNFSNILVPRFGVEYNFWDKLKLRTGYSFRPTPAPIPPNESKLIDASAHRVTFGLGYEFQLYQNIFLTTDAFASLDILHDARGTAVNTGLLIGAEYD